MGRRARSWRVSGHCTIHRADFVLVKFVFPLQLLVAAWFCPLSGSNVHETCCCPVCLVCCLAGWLLLLVLCSGWCPLCSCLLMFVVGCFCACVLGVVFASAYCCCTVCLESLVFPALPCFWGLGEVATHVCVCVCLISIDVQLAWAFVGGHGISLGFCQKSYQWYRVLDIITSAYLPKHIMDMMIVFEVVLIWFPSFRKLEKIEEEMDGGGGGSAYY